MQSMPQFDLLMQSCLQICQCVMLHASSLQLWHPHQSLYSQVAFLHDGTCLTCSSGCLSANAALPDLHCHPSQSVYLVSAARPGYTDPGPCSAIFQIAITYGFTPLMISLGTSYFRRLAASNYAMLQLGLESAQFCDFMLPMEVLPLGQSAKPLVGAIHAKYLPTKEAWLTLMHLTCIYLAAKVLEYVPCKNMLQTMMVNVYGAEPCNVSKDVVTHLELECLQALDWRLGPVYRTEP